MQELTDGFVKTKQDVNLTLSVLPSYKDSIYENSTRVAENSIKVEQNCKAIEKLKNEDFFKNTKASFATIYEEIQRSRREYETKFKPTIELTHNLLKTVASREQVQDMMSEFNTTNQKFLAF